MVSNILFCTANKMYPSFTNCDICWYICNMCVRIYANNTLLKGSAVCVAHYDCPVQSRQKTVKTLFKIVSVHLHKKRFTPHVLFLQA